MKSVRENKNRPPYSNTGVVNTEVKENVREGLSCCVDWFSFTYDYAVGLNYVIQDVLGLENQLFEPAEKAGNGYTSRLYSSVFCISVLWNASRLDMGINVQMSGNALRLFVSEFGEEELFLMMKKVENDNFSHVTRLDLALDDCSGKYYSVSDLRSQLEDGNIVSLFRSYEIRFKSFISDPSKFSEKTIYFGSMQSEISMRVYDKKLESEVKMTNRKKEYDRSVIPSFWVRWEMVFRRDRADQVLQKLVEMDFSLDAVFLGVLSDRFRIIEKGSDSNRSRCTMQPLWVRFIRSFEKIKLFFLSPDHMIDRSMRWIEGQVMPTLAGIVDAAGIDGYRYILSCIDYFRSREWVIDYKKEEDSRIRIISAADVLAYHLEVGF